MAKKKSKKKPTMTDEIEQSVQEAELILKFGEALYNRCRKQIGLTDVQ